MASTGGVAAKRFTAVRSQQSVNTRLTVGRSPSVRLGLMPAAAEAEYASAPVHVLWRRTTRRACGYRLRRRPRQCSTPEYHGPEECWHPSRPLAARCEYPGAGPPRAAPRAAVNQNPDAL